MKDEQFARAFALMAAYGALSLASFLMFVTVVTAGVEAGNFIAQAIPTQAAAVALSDNRGTAVKNNPSNQNNSYATTSGPQTDTANNSSAFSVSPTSGIAPLVVNFSYSYNSNTQNDRYTVNFGDGTSGQMSAMLTAIACAQGTNCVRSGSWVASHSYVSAGAYIANLVKKGGVCTVGGLSIFCGAPDQILSSVTITVSSRTDGSAGSNGGGDGTQSASGAAKIIQKLDAGELVAAVVAAPFNLMVYSLTDIFVMFGVGQ